MRTGRLQIPVGRRRAAAASGDCRLALAGLVVSGGRLVCLAVATLAPTQPLAVRPVAGGLGGQHLLPVGTGRGQRAAHAQHVAGRHRFEACEVLLRFEDGVKVATPVDASTCQTPWPTTVILDSVQVGAVSPAPQRYRELAVIPVPVSLSSGDKVMAFVTTPDAESA